MSNPGKKNMPRPIRALLAVALLAAVCGAGLLTGRMIRDLREHGSVFRDHDRLEVGDELPAVPVMTDDGRMASIRDLVGGSGAVLLFLDLDCPPCIDMALKWQHAIDSGWITQDRVLAIKAGGPLEPARQDGQPPGPGLGEVEYEKALNHGIGLSFVIDHEGLFMRQHGVVSLPLELIVDSAGIIRSASSSSLAAIDQTAVQLILGP